VGEPLLGAICDGWIAPAGIETSSRGLPSRSRSVRCERMHAASVSAHCGPLEVDDGLVLQLATRAPPTSADAAISLGRIPLLPPSVNVAKLSPATVTNGPTV